MLYLYFIKDFLNIKKLYFLNYLFRKVVVWDFCVYWFKWLDNIINSLVLIIYKWKCLV